MYIEREEGKHRGYATQVRFLLLNYYYYRQIIGSIGMKVWGAKLSKDSGLWISGKTKLNRAHESVAEKLPCLKVSLTSLLCVHRFIF